MSPTRHFLTAGLLLGLLAPATAADTANGAGATFPQPLYAKWAKAYGALSGAEIAYAGTGSGDGQKQATAGTVAFGGSDMPMPADALRGAGLIQFPSVIGGIVVVANLPGIDPGALTLDAESLAALMSGRLVSWDDPAIARLNPGVALPRLAVCSVHRSDSSGTTFVLTEYLSKAARDWRATIGQGTTVKWPGCLDVRGSDGMVRAVTGKPGAVGYVEYSYAKKGGLAYLNLVNAEGRSVQPTPMSFAAASASVDWADYLGAGDKSLTNRPGAAAWPLTTATFVLMRATDPAIREARRAVARMFVWALDKGGSIAEDLDYVPLPPEAAGAVRGALDASPDLGPQAASR